MAFGMTYPNHDDINAQRTSETINRLKQDLAEREAENLKLREALTKYAASYSYGDVARAALSTPQPSSYLEQWEMEKYGEPILEISGLSVAFSDDEQVAMKQSTRLADTPDGTPLYVRKD